MSHPLEDSGSIDFEFTDFDEARQVLDQVPTALPAAPERGPEYWASQRRAVTATDRALTGATMNWVVGLPPALRPVKLCERFPRIANTVAQAWPDRSQFQALLDGLLTDRRGRRRGFPIAVQAELERLGRFRAAAA